MNFIIVGGYVYSGSSIANDLIKECEGYKTFGTEFKLFTGVDGIIDLENALFSKSIFYKDDIAFERFRKFYMQLNNKKFRVYDYETFFCKEFMEIMDGFMDAITERQYLAGSSLFSLQNGERLFSKGVKGLRLELNKRYIDTKKTRFFDLSREDFYIEVQNLLHIIFDRFENEGFHTCILDQGLYPAFANKLKDYFPEGKMIIVDRDPRDNAISLIESGKAVGAELRYNLNPEFYAKWFSKSRRIQIDKCKKDILQMRYEDFALKYEQSKTKVFDFVNIDANRHIEKFKYFNPKRTAAKVGRWKVYENNKYFDRKDWIEFCETVSTLIPEFCYEE